MRDRMVRGRGSGPPAPCCVHQVVGSDAWFNHHFRAAKHRVLDTHLGQSKPRITLGGWVESGESHGVVRGSKGAGARRRTASTRCLDKCSYVYRIVTNFIASPSFECIYVIARTLNPAVLHRPRLGVFMY